MTQCTKSWKCMGLQDINTASRCCHFCYLPILSDLAKPSAHKSFSFLQRTIHYTKSIAISSVIIIMHFKTLLISTLLSSIPVIRAATSIADVNAANQALSKQADDNDAFVQKLNVANVATNEKVRLMSTII